MSAYSPAHERANVITHLIGFVFGLVALPWVLIRAYGNAGVNGEWILGLGLYSIGFLMVFGFSSLYHFYQQPARKTLMKMWDHISIYYLIAGTFTPFIMAYGQPPSSHYFLMWLWSIALAGTVFKIFFTGRYRLISTALYVAMGWMVLFAPHPFKENLPDDQFFWIAVGGASYTIGVIFYLVKKIPYHHAIWHVFVLGGALCHFIGIWRMVENAV